MKWPNQKYPSVKAWKLWPSKTEKVFDIQDNSTLGLFSRLGEWLTPASQRNMTHRWYYSLRRQEIIISNPTKITSYFANKVEYESMKVNFDSKTDIEELYENGVPVLLDSDCFTPFNKFKVIACITSPPPTLFKYISVLPMQ